MYRVWGFITEYSVLLLFGSAAALLWANLDFHSYHHLVDYPLLVNDYVGKVHDGERVLTVHFLINDMAMALFFAIAGKEVWEAVILEGGSMRGRRALTPLVATVGGMIGPAGLYLLGAYALGKMAILGNGWAIPTATDIAFSYLIGRTVFGPKHPAVRFLLLLAIADDAIGLLIIAIFYPQGEIIPEWLLLSAGAAFVSWLLFNRLPRRLDRGDPGRRFSSFAREKIGFWPYAVAGCLSWYGFQQAGLHPVLGLLPIIPAIPHSDISFGMFSEAKQYLSNDLLTRIEHSLKVPVDIVLLFFGLANAGVEFSSVGDATWLVLLGLLVGKPLGVWACGMFAVRVLKFGLDESMDGHSLFLVGAIAGIGFTVALFVAAVAFPAGLTQDAAKMGALLSFGMAGIAIVLGRMLKIKRIR